MLVGALEEPCCPHKTEPGSPRVLCSQAVERVGLATVHLDDGVNHAEDGDLDAAVAQLRNAKAQIDRAIAHLVEAGAAERCS